MSHSDDHPEQDPAEGSREIVERDLIKQADKRRDAKNGESHNPAETSSAGAEAAEPSPGN